MLIFGISRQPADFKSSLFAIRCIQLYTRAWLRFEVDFSEIKDMSIQRNDLVRACE